MLKCINGHEQPDDAKFCGVCGLVVEPSTTSDLAEWADASEDEIELDLMGDADDTDDTDDTDEPELEFKQFDFLLLTTYAVCTRVELFL